MRGPVKALEMSIVGTDSDKRPLVLLISTVRLPARGWSKRVSRGCQGNRGRYPCAPPADFDYNRGPIHVSRLRGNGPLPLIVRQRLGQGRGPTHSPSQDPA